MEELKRRGLEKSTHTRLLLNLSQVAAGHGEDHWNRSNDLLLQYDSLALFRPFVSANIEDIHAKMWESYVREFGDPNTPEAQAEIQKILDMWASTPPSDPMM